MSDIFKEQLEYQRYYEQLSVIVAVDEPIPEVDDDDPGAHALWGGVFFHKPIPEAERDCTGCGGSFDVRTLSELGECTTCRKRAGR